jgi:FMN phosphatase YigB (HAD superfamily)
VTTYRAAEDGLLATRRSKVATQAVLFDLGNTLVGYYTSADFPNVLRRCLRECAIVSNTPWGSPAGAWREELSRHGLLEKVDAVVFCMDVGRRKPHRAPFDRALALLEVAPADALFVGDDQRWDVVGAQNAGIRPVLLGQRVEKSPAARLTIQDLREIIQLLSTDDPAQAVL